MPNVMAPREELEIEIGPSGKVTARTIGIKGPRCLDVAELLARIVGREESRRTDQRVLRGGGASPGTRRRETALVSGPCSAATASFENMPGVQTCGRCGASLQLASLAIDVHPPRAGRAASAGGGGSPSPGTGTASAPLPPRAPAARMIAGLAVRPAGARPAPADDRSRLGAHYVGRSARGRWMFWGYLGAPVVGPAVRRHGAGLVAVGLGDVAPRGVHLGHRGRRASSISAGG